LQTGTAGPEVWDPGAVYVIGHQRPDTDAIASALGYAWVLRALGEDGVVPARAGQLPAQAQFALRRFGQAPPRLLIEAAPTFGHAARPQATLSPDAPLMEAMARLAAGERVVPVVDGEGKPLGGVTPMALARAYAAPGPGGGPEALARPCGKHAEELPSFSALERISDHRRTVLRSGADDFLVLDGEGRYVGVASRGRVLEPPRARLILVDHNELSQAVAGAEEAQIVGVLDHHRLGNPPTAAPIPFVVEPVGSTCTLVAEQCRTHGLEPPAGLAGMMLSGILSDTLVFRSPTTTDRDHAAAEWLAGLIPLEIGTYGEELLRASPGLAARQPQEILDADRKSYQMGGLNVTIAQVEVSGMQELPHHAEALLAALEEIRTHEGAALACLMITDVVMGRSRLLCRGEARILSALPFSRAGAHEFDLGERVSRKKQLVPALYDALGET
jgi:manganese-dependent inorganic pyrophosphatase